MAAASSVKPKPKFSSRNVNALYKAPALRGGEAGGVSAGYRTGGVNNLNRLIVLRGPARSGALGVVDANTAVVPTPINTPSLRKEHMGQDIHVNLVLAGKGSGWGSSAGDGAAVVEEASVKAEAHLQQAGEEAASVAAERREPASVWNGGPPTALVSRPRQPAASNVAPVGSSASCCSGRWGDDAVEEDLAQVDIERCMERRREFPDLRAREDSPQDLRYHSHQDPPLQSHITRSVSSQRQQPLLYDDHTTCSRYGPGCSGGQERHRGQHLSFQDARYDSPVRNETHGQYEFHHGGNQSNLRRSISHEARRFDEESAPQGNDAQHSERMHHQNEPHRGLATIANQLTHNATAKSLKSVWKIPPNTTTAASDMWKMSEAEVKVAAVPQLHKSNVFSPLTSVARNSAFDSSERSVSVSTVRILKRNGPRMLFDHKSGTMVEVEDSKSHRRSKTATPAQPNMSMEAETTKAEQGTQVIEIAKREPQQSPPTQANSPPEKTREEDQVSLSRESVEAMVRAVSRVDGVKRAGQRPTSPRLLTSSNSKTKTREPKPKYLPMGGKMKRVVVAYRPVVKADITVTTDSHDAVTAHDPAPSQLKEGRKATEEGCQGAGSESSNRESNAVVKTKQKRTFIKTRVEPTKATGAADDCAETNIPNESKLPKADNRGPRSGSDHKSKRPPSKVGGVDCKLQEATVETESIVIASGDVHQVEEEKLDDGGGSFTTVKSRRTILLERKKQREQLAAALSGFHVRGGVQRPISRLTVPASIARYGKRGHSVAFKHQSETAFIAASTLDKSFIDVIRPPTVARKVEHSTQDAVVESSEEPVSQNSVVHQSKENRKLRGDGSLGRSKRQDQDTKPRKPVMEARSPTCQKIHVGSNEAITGEKESTSKEKDNAGGPSTIRTVRAQSLKPDSRPHRASTVKREIKIYVAKVTAPVQGDTAMQVPVAASVTTSVRPVASVAETASKLSQSAGKPAPRAESSSTDSASSSAPSSGTSGVSPSAVVAVGTLRQDTATKPAPKEKKDGKTSKPDVSTSRQDRAPQYQSAPNTTKSESKKPESGSQAAVPTESTSVSEAPTKMPRRASNSKPRTTKSVVSRPSAHKVYKKVYVVKPTSAVAAASPSAA
jgi:hypothetical protein